MSWGMGGRWRLLLGASDIGVGPVDRVGSTASSGGGRGFIVEEVKAATEAEGVVVLVVVMVALRLGPELVGVLRDSRSRRGRRLVREEGVWFHLAELSGGETGSSVRKGKSTMAPFIDSDCYSVKNCCLTVPGLGRLDHGSRKVMQPGCCCGERVSLPVELFGDGAYET